MKPLKTKAETRPVEPEQESYPVCCIESVPPSAASAPESTALPAPDEGGQAGWPTLIAAFLDYQRGLGRAASTIESHIIDLQYWTRYLDTIGGPAPAAITPRIVADYQAYIYQYRSRYGRPFVLQTQIGILNCLQVFYKFLLKTGRILSNPAEAIQLPREPKRLPGTFLTTAEMKKLLRQPDTSTVLGFRDRTIYEVLYSTGLRVRELTGMRVQDLPPSLSALVGPELRRAGDLSRGMAPEGSLFIPQSKHYKDRYVPFGATAGRYLAEYLDHVRPRLVRREGEDLVFLGRCGGRLDVGGVQQKLRIYATRAKIKKHLTIHVFRHTLATEMLRHGADLRQIQEMLGHKNLKTTQIYTHIVKGELKRVQAHCHPREQTDLPDGFVRYRGRKWTQDGDQ